MEPYKITPATAAETPIILSVPHCGVAFPPALAGEYQSHLIDRPDDTDWFVDQLYDFVPSLGVTMIRAVYSRWVIDLNRNPDYEPLYHDGRIITAICPVTTFLNEPLYRDGRPFVSRQDVEQRLHRFYWPYHEKIQSLLDERKKKFGKVLLWDCHSIRQVVPTIQKEKFPDLVLGDGDSTSADASLIEIALHNLRSGTYTLQHNHPFKGGTITRTFGRPKENQHALQLEMTKKNYMNDAETEYDTERANRMRVILRRTFEALIDQLLK